MFDLDFLQSHVFNCKSKISLSIDLDFGFIDNKTVLKEYNKRDNGNKYIDKIFLFTILVSNSYIWVVIKHLQTSVTLKLDKFIAT